MKKQTLRIFLVCYAAYLFIYVARLNLSIAAPDLKAIGVLNTEQIGLLGGIFSVVYACGRLLSGILSDRHAPWKMISIGLVLCGLSNIGFGLFPPFYAILLLWGINAIAQSMLWGSILRILSLIYPEDVAKKRAAYMATTSAAGNLVAILLNTELINRFGIAWAFLVPGSITVTISLLVVLYTRHIHSPVQERTSQSYSAFLRKPSARKMLIPSMVHGVLKDNISLWIVVYIMDTFGVNLEQSSYYILLIPTVGFLAKLLAPELYRLTGDKDRPLLIWGFVASAAGSLLLAVCIHSAWFAVVCLSFVFMAISIINTCLLSFFPLRFAKEGYVASVSGILDFASYLGTGISSIAFGIMIERFGYGAMFATWAVLCGLAIVLVRKKETSE